MKDDFSTGVVSDLSGDAHVPRMLGLHPKLHAVLNDRAAVATVYSALLQLHHSLSHRSLGHSFLRCDLTDTLTGTLSEAG